MVGPCCRDPRVDKRAVPMLLIAISVGSGLAARRPREERAGISGAASGRVKRAGRQCV